MYTGMNTNYSWMYPSYSNYGWNNSMYNYYTPNMNFNSGYSWNTNPWYTNSWNTNYGYQPSYNFSQPALTTNTNSNLQTPANNPTFTSNPTFTPNSTFTPNPEQAETNAEEEKEGLSTGAKWGIGLSIAAAIAIGVEVFAFKSKHLEKIWKKIKGVADDIPNSSNTPDVPNTPPSGPTTPPSGPTTPPSGPTTPPSGPTTPPSGPTTPPSGPTTPPSGPTTPPSGPTTPPSGPTTPPSGPTTPPSGPTTPPSGPTTPPSGPTTPPSGPSTPPSGPTTPPSGPTTPPSGPATPPSKPVIPPIIDDGIEFKNLDDAKSWFDSVGIRTEYTAGAERHLEDLNQIKKDLATLQKNGVEFPRPDALVLTDWKNKTEIEEICRKMDLSEDVIEKLARGTYDVREYWGTVRYLKDGSDIVFINNGDMNNYKRFIHEMGHLHQDLETSYWHHKGLKNNSFRAMQHYILGLPEPINLATHHPDYSRASLCDIFDSTISTKNPKLKEKLNSLFPELQGNVEGLHLTAAYKADGSDVTYIINSKKMVEKMYSESGVYNPYSISENVAEIFQHLNNGRSFSDEVMLMYDFCGGGRVPNLVIKGQKYDDYIASLYQNEELLQKLRDSIEIKQV